MSLINEKAYAETGNMFLHTLIHYASSVASQSFISVLAPKASICLPIIHTIPL